MSLSKFDIITGFIRSRQSKEIFLAHMVILALCGLIYMFSTIAVVVVCFSILAGLEMFFFHTLWIYRDNRQSGVKTPVRNALIKEFKNIAVALVGVLFVLALCYMTYLLFGLNPITGITAVAFMIFGLLILKSYKAISIAQKELE